MRIASEEEVRGALEGADLIPVIKKAFVRYSQGEAVVAPITELSLDEPPGDVQVQAGYVRGGDTIVVKVSSGFYDNDKKGLPRHDGVFMLLDQKTGLIKCLLLAEGYLTALRSGVAGAIAALYCAPDNVQAIGVLGAGTEARFQVRALKEATTCRNLVVWDRREEHLPKYVEDMEAEGFAVRPAKEIQDLAESCRLIITTTPSSRPLLEAAWIQPGTHITAVGGDSPYKQELDPAIFLKAERVIADSVVQCTSRGEIAHAQQAGTITRDQVLELGHVVEADKKIRKEKDEITIVDLTGIVSQDIEIARLAFSRLKK